MAGGYIKIYEILLSESIIGFMGYISILGLFYIDYIVQLYVKHGIEHCNLKSQFHW